MGLGPGMVSSPDLRTNTGSVRAAAWGHQRQLTGSSPWAARRLAQAAASAVRRRGASSSRAVRQLSNACQQMGVSCSSAPRSNSTSAMARGALCSDAQRQVGQRLVSAVQPDGRPSRTAGREPAPTPATRPLPVCPPQQRRAGQRPQGVVAGREQASWPAPSGGLSTSLATPPVVVETRGPGGGGAERWRWRLQTIEAHSHSLTLVGRRLPIPGTAPSCPPLLPLVSPTWPLFSPTRRPPAFAHNHKPACTPATAHPSQSCRRVLGGRSLGAPYSPSLPQGIL